MGLGRRAREQLEKIPLRMVVWGISLLLGFLPLLMGAIAFHVAERPYEMLRRPELIFLSVPIFIGIARDFGLSDVSAAPRLLFLAFAVFGLVVTAPMYQVVRLAEIQNSPAQFADWLMLLVPGAAIIVSWLGQLILSDVDAK